MATGSHALARQADAIYYNGSILTMAGATPSYVEALAVKGGKIAFAGGKESAMQIKSDTTKLIDLDGKALLPGFLDAHSHYINSLLVANQTNRAVIGKGVDYLFIGELPFLTSPTSSLLSLGCCSHEQLEELRCKDSNRRVF